MRPSIPRTPRLATVMALGWLVVASCGGEDAVAPEQTSTLRVLSGNAQTGIAGAALARTLTVELSGPGGGAAAAVTVRFIASGGGAVTDTTLVTDLNGRASTSWFLGPDAAEPQTVAATASGQTVTFTATPTEPIPGVTYRGRNGYIEYIPGTLPIIISAPHGGDLVPTEIPDRTSGTTVRDTQTEALAREIAAALVARTGDRPHLVICRLRRTKLDANREIVEAAQGNRFAQRAWFEWHSFIETARSTVADQHGQGFYIDLHGHGHEIQRIELGYMLSSGTLALGDAAINTATHESRSSIRTLSVRSPASFAEILRGPTSLGSLLEEHGVSAVPSASQPDPDGNPYFSGGYNTERHGSMSGGQISGVQIETNWTGVRDTPTNRAAFAAALSAVLDSYLSMHAGLEIAPLAAR